MIVEERVTHQRVCVWVGHDITITCSSRMGGMSFLSPSEPSFFF